MASIPLAIKPPAPPPNPIEQYGQAQGVLGMINQQRLQQQQIAQNNLALNDQKAASDAMHEWDRQDINDLPGLYIKHGASANAVLSLKQSIIQQQTARAMLDTDTLNNEAKRHDNIAGAMNNAVVTNKDGSFNADATSAAIASLGKNPEFIRNLAPDEVSQLPSRMDYFGTLAKTNPDQFQQEWKVAANGHLAESQINKNALDQATAQKTSLENQNTQSEANARNAYLAANPGKTINDYNASVAGQQKQAEAAGTIKGQQEAMGPGKAFGTTLDVQEANDWLSKNPGKTLSDYQSYKTEQLAKFNYDLEQRGIPMNPGSQGKTGQDFLQTLDPARQQVVKAYAEGRQTFPNGFALRTPYFQGLQRDLLQYDPQWSEQRAEIRKNFTVGKDADNIGSLNTAAVHLDALSEAAKALANGSFTPGNAAWNQIRSVFGNSAPTTFETVKNAVAGEQANALKGSATDQEISNVAKTINAANSPQQLADAIDKASMPIMAQKLNTYKERYEQQIPGDTVYSPVLPSAAAVFQKHGVGATSAPAQSAGHKVGDLIVQGNRTFKATAVDKDGKVTAADPQ